MSTGSCAVGPDANGMRAGSRSLLERRLGRGQVGRHGLQDCHKMAGKWQHLEGAFVTHCHSEARRWRRGIRLVVAIERVRDALERHGNILREGRAVPQPWRRTRRNSDREASRFRNPVTRMLISFFPYYG